MASCRPLSDISRWQIRPTDTAGHGRTAGGVPFARCRRGDHGWIGCEYRPSSDTAPSLGSRDRFAFICEDTNYPTG